MEEAGSSENETQRKPRYDAMSKTELETLAVSAIRKHRALLAADQAVYEDWLRASDDPSTSRSMLPTLQEEYLTRQKNSAAQQEELSVILDALGFVPDVPFDDDQGSDEASIFGNGNELRD
ncbi:transcriptional repressor TraM [Ensifer sp. NPDC090286]|uniref:transcriptional repressor TraM n=1 Tax=Ensifer sp. NPDC090286 TaxID=3363991 RepID=UPI00383A36E8